MDMYGFAVQNWKAQLAGFPREDSFTYDEERKIACVADGVTRDFLDGSVVTRDIKGLVKVLTGKYPEYAKDASRICTKTFLETKSFEEANRRIWLYNLEQGLVPSNYTDRDLAGCTAAGFWEEDGFLHWQFICDSGIVVVDSSRNPKFHTPVGIYPYEPYDGSDLKFHTPNEGPHSKEKNPHLEKILSQHGGFNNPEGRRIIRSQYRNNPKEESAYGVLTGEETALPYIKKGMEKLNSGDYVLAFTDGVGDIIFDDDSKRKERPLFKDRYERLMAVRPFPFGGGIPEQRMIPILNGAFVYILKQDNPLKLEKFCQKRVHTEGTLVVYKVE